MGSNYLFLLHLGLLVQVSLLQIVFPCGILIGLWQAPAFGNALEFYPLSSILVCKWKVGNGSSVSLWFDRWLDDDPIALKFPHFQFSQFEIVATIFNGNSWTIPNYFPQEIRSYLQQQVQGIQLQPVSTSDSLLWTGNNLSLFSLSRAWKLIRSRMQYVPWVALVWTPFVYLRVSCMIWRLLHKITPTKTWAKAKGISLPSRCFIYRYHEETEAHLFFNCHFASSLWTWLLFINGSSSPSRSQLLPFGHLYLLIEMILEENVHLKSSFTSSLSS
ncbi:hypothetical protein AAC387_Pa03g3873 [Persea americana]